jgi:hypothetical protein
MALQRVRAARAGMQKSQTCPSIDAADIVSPRRHAISLESLGVGKERP